MFTTSSRGTAERNLEKGKGEHWEYFLKEKIFLRAFLFPVKKVEGSRILVEGTRMQLLQGRQFSGQRSAALGPEPLLPPVPRTGEHSPARTKPSCWTKAVSLPCCSDDQQK
ncbi:unnamed protein product [Coccothraustes coccothraustes]